MSGQPLLAGIYRRLKDSDTPWEDRLRLARFAWSSSQCFLPNKQQVLLDWACNTLANHKKFQIPDDVVTTLWQYFHDALHSKQLQQKEDTSSAVTVKDVVYQVLCDALAIDGNYVTMATTCCHVILQSASLSRSLTAKYEAMSDLLSSFLCLVIKYLQSQKSSHPDTDDGCLGTAVACLHILMRTFSVAHRQKQIQTQRKAFASLFEKLLIPSLRLYTCDTIGSYHGIKTQIEELIGYGVFNKEMCEAYSRYLIKSDDKPAEGKDKYLEPQIKDIANLMEFLQKQAANNDVDMGLSSSVVSGLPVLYTAFMTAYKPSADVMFAMCKKLCSIMGVVVHPEESGIQSDTTVCDWQYILPALEQMLSIVHSSNTYTITADNAGGKLQYKWLHHLLKIILNNADRSCVSFYKCLHVLLDMNHLIIEEELTLVWNVSLVHVSKFDIDTHKVDTLKEARTEFLGALMQTYVKLRQFDKLLECLLASYRNDENVQNDSQVTFDPGFIHRFCECIQALPPGLTLDLWKLFQDDLLNSYINHLSDLSISGSPKKKRKRMQPSDSVRGIGQGLEQVAVTFHIFLMAARLIDLSVTMVMMDRLETLIKETWGNVLKPLHEACNQQGKEIHDNLLFPTLLLTYAMGELQLVLLQHTKYGCMQTKYGDMETDGEQATPDIVAILQTIPHIRGVLEVKPDEIVDDVLGMFGKYAETKRTLYLVHLLRAQQAKGLLLHAPANAQTPAIIHRLSGSIFSSDVKIDKESDAASAWDGQIASISSHNYTIAHLHFLTQTLSIWLPYTSSDNQHSVARLLVHAFNTDSQQGSPAGTMTLRDVARSFLSSDVCLESKDLQSALLVAGLTCVADSLTSPVHSPKKRKKTDSASLNHMASMFGQLLHMLSDMTADKDANWEILETIGKRYSDMLQSKESGKDFNSTKVAEYVRTVDNILNVLHQLPLPHLLPGNQDRCILGLVILDTLVASWLLADDTCSTLVMKTLIVCRNIEIEILKSMKSTGILKCINVSAMLADSIANHSETGKYLLDTSSPHQEELKRNYLELDDITQKLVLQWMQKIGDRSTHEGSVLHDITGLIKMKLSTMNNSLMKSPSIDRLHGGIPLLSTTYNIIQMNTEVRGQEVRGEADGRMDMSRYLQSILGNSLELLLQSNSDIDPLLVGSLAKTSTRVITLNKMLDKDEAQSSSNGDHDSTSVAMETDDAAASMTHLKKKFKRGSESSDVEKRDVASSVELWHGVLEPVLTVVLRHLDITYGDKKAQEQIQKREHLDKVGETSYTTSRVLPVCLGYVREVCDFIASHRKDVRREVVDQIWKSICGVLWLMEDSDLKDCIFASASNVLVSMEEEQFRQALESNVQDLGTTQLHPDSVASLKALVLIWQVLPDCHLSSEKLKSLEQYIPKVLTALQCLLVETIVDWSTEGSLAVNILRALTAMVTSEKKRLEPKQAMQTLQASLTIQFITVPDNLFPSVFSTLYLMVKSILQAFPQTVLHCMGAYVACVQHMLRGVMGRCHQQSGNTRCIGDQELFSCAESMERLLTQFASHKKDVSKSVIVLISEYISELQKGTLLPFVKKALVVGVYNLVDICDEKALALMQSTLPLNLKEIYTEFYSDYKKYHKYQGKV